MVVVFVFVQLSDVGFNLQSDWEPFKDLNLGSNVILISFLQNYSGQNVKGEWIEGETEDRNITKEEIIFNDP